MSQQHEANHQPAQQAADWRQRITELQGADGWRLVPVKGKNPSAWGTEWQLRQHTVASVIASPGATGFGLITGPQPTGDSLVCIDFDGALGAQFGIEQGFGPDSITTWKVARTGADGLPTPGRIKLLFRATPAQAERLGPAVSSSYWLSKPPAGAGAAEKREGVEVFHHTGKQVVILRSHPEGGVYFWPEGCGPEALATLPDDWFGFVRLLQELIEAGKGVETSAERKNRTATSTSGDWPRLRKNEPCPICGRHGESQVCARHRTSGAIRCLDGSTFSFVGTHGNLKSGDLVQGTDSVVYAFTRSDDNNPIGLRGNFVIHKPRERPALPTTPQPWQQPTTPTTDWMASLPSSNGNGNGNGHSDEVPAAEQVIDAVAVPEGGNASDEAKLIAQLQYLADQIERHEGGAKPFDQWSRPPYLDQFDRIVHAAAALQERRGATSLPAVAATAADLFGITSNPWRDLVKPKLIEHQRVRATLASQAKLARANEALAASCAFEGLTPPEGQEVRPLLLEMGAGPSDGKRMPLGPLVKRLQEVAAARPRTLRWNLICDQVEYTTPDGVQVAIPSTRIGLAYVPLAEHGYEVGKQAASDALVFVAQQDTYNPVREYLQVLSFDTTVPAFDLNTAASVLLGVDDPLSAVLMRKMLISAVARAMEPGCFVKHMLVLKGKQDAAKSKLWRHLMPDCSQGRWTVDTVPEQEKDFKMNIHRCWVFEIAELDQITATYKAGKLKSIISSPSDDYRPPYAAANINAPRHSVMVGTCNRDDFLRDTTGSVRYWVIDTDLGRGIDVAAAETHRDAIWKAAHQAWQQRTGVCDYWLTEAEQDQLKARNGDFEPGARFDAPLAKWVKNLPPGACFELPTALINCGALPDRARCDTKALAEAGKVLRGLGWIKSRNVVNGVQLMLWRREGSPLAIDQLKEDQPPNSWPNY